MNTRPLPPTESCLVPSSLYVAWLTGWFLVTGTLLLACKTGFSSDILMLGCIIYLIVALVHLVKVALAKGQRDWLAPDIVFLSFFGLYHYGFAIPSALGLIPLSERVFYDREVANASVFFSSLCGIAFLLGYELPGAIRRLPPTRLRRPRLSTAAVSAAKMVLSAGILMMAIGAVEVGIGNITRADFFAQAQLAAQDIRLYSMGGLAVDIGLVLYFISCRYVANRAMSGALFPLLITAYVAFHFFTGRRAAVFSATFPMLLAYNYLCRPIRGRYLLVAAASALFMMSVVRDAREHDDFSIQSVLSSVRSPTDSILRASEEAGGSLMTVDCTMSLVPEEEGHWWGESYGSAALECIPNIMPAVRAELPAPSVWLTEAMIDRGVGGGAGLGSSVVTEAYLNCGYAGFAVLLLIGAFHRFLYDAALKKPSLARLSALTMGVLSLALWTRNWSGVYFRPVAWTFLIACGVQALARAPCLGGLRSAGHDTTGVLSVPAQEPGQTGSC